MNLENSREERIKELKRLKTTLQAVLELRKELEKQGEQVEIAPNQSQKRSAAFKQRHVSPAKRLQNQRRTARDLSLAARRQRARDLSLVARRQIANEYAKKMNKQAEENKKPELKLVYVR